jgi:hypothetical protein
MAASPAQVLKAILVQLNLVEAGPTPVNELPPCFVSSMPDDPDNAVCIYDTIGRMFGRDFGAKGRQNVFPRVQIKIRSVDYSGWSTILGIATALDALPATQIMVPDDGLYHYVSNVGRTSQVIALGEEVGKRRQLWAVNCRIVFQENEPTIA